MSMILNIFGGLGLFLLGMWLMTDGLKVAAGQALRRILRSWTDTPMRGLFSGFLITSLVQSSSAVTVATIGFVNAGILSLKRAIGVIYGSNLGTTTTAWLVALVGFHVNIKVMALPMIGLGMVLHIIAPGTRKAALGHALAGFGVFFLGIDVLKGGFAGLDQSWTTALPAVSGMVELLLYLGLGILFTIMMQSSSAAVAIILTASSGGVVTLANAAAAVIGANLGTTSTAMLSVIGATPMAKRVATAHVVFNLLTALAAFLVLPLLIGLIGRMELFADPTANMPILLALFHTTFNLLGVVLILPATPRLSAFLATRFRTAEEDASKPRYLDDNVLSTPSLALDALALEVNRMWAMVRRLTLAAMQGSPANERLIQRETMVLERLGKEISDFTAKLQRSGLSQRVAEALPILLRVQQYFLRAGELSMDVGKNAREFKQVRHPVLSPRMEELHEKIAGLLTTADPCSEAFSEQRVRDGLAQAIETHRDLKRQILEESARGDLDLGQMELLLERYSNLRRLLEQAVKGVLYLASLKPTVHAICPSME
ncbi:MAG: Na/Pi cotransporter family protein [Desulfohalobiaceae bacterium]